jgi:hypothetical protein
VVAPEADYRQAKILIYLQMAIQLLLIEVQLAAVHRAIVAAQVQEVRAALELL